MANTKLIQSIDVIRGFSILVVLFLHFRLVTTTVQGPVPAWAVDAFLRVSDSGSYGVTIFFVVSGFLITRMIDGPERAMFSPDKRTFYFRRVSRILPMLVIICSIGSYVLLRGSDRSGALAATFRDPRVAFDGTFWASIFFFFFNWLRILNSRVSFGYGLNWDVLWSLSIEEQFYIGYPFLLAWIRSTRRLVPLLVAIIVIGPLYRVAATVLFPTSFLVGFTGSFAAFDQLAMGVLAYLSLREGWLSLLRGRWRSAVAVAGAALAVGAYLLTSPAEAVDRVYGPSVLGLGVALLIATGLDHPIFEHSLWRPLKLLGRASYEAYLLHALVLYVLWPYLLEQSFVLALCTFVVAVGAVSLAVHLYVSEPLKNKLASTLPRLLPGRTPLVPDRASN